jgi:hypothetical protein
MRLVGLALLVASCTTRAEPVESPMADAPPAGLAFTIDLATCPNERAFEWLPLGSAWVQSSANGDTCDLLLGGESENPMYDGSPTQQCAFPRSGSITIPLRQGGPASLDSPLCTTL